MGDALDTEVDTQVGSSVPGIALIVATAERVLLSCAWGLADVAHEVEMSTDAACNWFSMTKPVTATVAARLAEQGLLDLDAPVHEYYEPFRATSPSSREQGVRVRHLLSHSSGLANPLPLRWIHRADEPGPLRAEFVRALVAKHGRLKSDPGSSAVYSNLGFLVLGEVIEAASGRSYEECVQENLLRPLGLERTGFAVRSDEFWATPYQRRRTIQNLLLPLLLPRRIVGRNEGRFRALEHFYLDGAPYGGLVGPTVEAARFVQAHLGDGELDGERILLPDSAKAMRVIHARGKNFEVGMGWYRRGATADTDYVEHLGGGAGFWNCMRLYPQRQVGLVMMGNATSYDHDAIARAALHRVRDQLD